MRHFANGAATFFVCHAGMRRFACDNQFEHACAFASGDAASTIGTGRFRHERIDGPLGKRFDVRARGVTADLFIGDKQKVNRHRRRTWFGKLTQSGQR